MERNTRGHSESKPRATVNYKSAKTATSGEPDLTVCSVCESTFEKRGSRRQEDMG